MGPLASELRMRPPLQATSTACTPLTISPTAWWMRWRTSRTPCARSSLRRAAPPTTGCSRCVCVSGGGWGMLTARGVCVCFWGWVGEGTGARWRCSQLRRRLGQRQSLHTGVRAAGQGAGQAAAGRRGWLLGGKCAWSNAMLGAAAGFQRRQSVRLPPSAGTIVARAGVWHGSCASAGVCEWRLLLTATTCPAWLLSRCWAPTSRWCGSTAGSTSRTTSCQSGNSTG